MKLPSFNKPYISDIVFRWEEDGWKWLIIDVTRVYPGKDYFNRHITRRYKVRNKYFYTSLIHSYKYRDISGMMNLSLPVTHVTIYFNTPKERFNTWLFNKLYLLGGTLMWIYIIIAFLIRRFGG